MSIDMSQFHQVFYEESFEGLDIMETGLMELDLGEADSEAINTIFRAAHSIKGGAGTFGFTDIASFTHVMETLLDEMRAGDREVTREAVDLLLISVDILRDMLSAESDDEDIDREKAATVQASLEAMLGSEDGVVNDTHAAENLPEAGVSDSTETVWEIVFEPHLHLFKTGNDPLRLFSELSSLGTLKSQADVSDLPHFDQLDPEEAYIKWRVELVSDCDKAAIEEVFEWVDEDCNLSITCASGPSESSEAESATVMDTPTQESSELIEQKPAATDAAVVVPKAGDDSATPRPEKKRAAKSTNTENVSIRVGTDKIDALINMVGELVITQSMLSQITEDFSMESIEKLRDGIDNLERNTRELQENVLQIRMLPISFSFNRFPRLVRDLTSKLGKKIELKMSGEQTEIDKTVMEKIGDPLVHLVRNSLDHGIEMPEVRKAAGKPETGILHLNAYHEGGNIVIEISDDGAGLNKERILEKAREKGLVGQNEELSDEKIHELIFAPGFSTAAEISDVSGRGVGMDVVVRNIKTLGGMIEIKSEEGKGSTFTIRLPLTLAIVDGQLVRVGRNTYIIPLVSIVETLQIDQALCNSITGKAELYKLRDEYISVLRLHRVLDVEPDNYDLDKGLLVVAETEGQKVGILVDDLQAQQQFVIKSLETNYQKVEGISGATILGDGSAAMILDLQGLVKLSSRVTPELPKTKLDKHLKEAKEEVAA